jgi:acyl carrier protein
LKTERERLLEEFERYYREFKDTMRSVRPEDELDRLGIDSLLAQELLAELEDNHEVDLMRDVRLLKVRTVSDLLDVLEDHLRESTGSA